MPYLTAAGRRLEFSWTGPGPEDAPTLVFLHEGLGSVSMWRDFPARAAEATGCGALVYSRWGYGGSEPIDPDAEARAVTYMHEEAIVALPEVLHEAGVREAILIGHSDGGSIALIYAGSDRARAPGAPRLLGVITLAAHVFNEDISVRSIAAARQAWESADLRKKLARHHGDNVEGAFRGWNDIWLHPDFLDWNIEEYLPGITCPVLAIQGEDDEYGTLRQVRAIASGVSGRAETLVLPDCGHSAYRDRPRETLAAIIRFVEAVAGPAVEGNCPREAS